MRAARIRNIIAVAMLVLAAEAPARAASEQFVYWPYVTDGGEYRRVPYPKEAGHLAALAGSEIVIEARRAQVSYWPITREFITDVGHGKPVDGTVEVIGSGETRTAADDVYTVWYPAGLGAGPAQLVRGAAAEKLYAEYVSAARDAATKEQQYQRIVAEHQAAAEAWIKLAGTRQLKDMPPPPPDLTVEPPAPFNAYASEPRRAAILKLLEGSYGLRMRDGDGQIIAGSERTLEVFAPIDQAIGYVLRPQDRWTRPAVSFSPQDTIYTTARADIFLQPVPVVEYASRDFTRLFDPQSFETSDTEATIWVPRPGGDQLSSSASLAVWRGKTQIGSLQSKGYRVNQLAGAGRGYTIEEFSTKGGTLQPDFQAMRLDRQIPGDRIGLVEEPNGSLSGNREFVIVNTPPLWLVFVPAFIPLIIGFARQLYLRRARGIRRRPVPERDLLKPAAGSATFKETTKKAAVSVANGRT